MCGAVAWASRSSPRSGRRDEDSARDRPRARCSPPRRTPRRPRRRPSSSPARKRVGGSPRRASIGSFGDDVGDARDAPTFAFAACGVSAPRLSEFGDDRESSRDARGGRRGERVVRGGTRRNRVRGGFARSGKETLARCAAGMDPFAGDALFANGAASARTGGVAALAAAGVGACLRDDAFVGEAATPVERTWRSSRRVSRRETPRARRARRRRLRRSLRNSRRCRR